MSLGRTEQRSRDRVSVVALSVCGWLTCCVSDHIMSRSYEPIYL